MGVHHRGPFQHSICCRCMARSSTDPGNAWLLSEEEKDMMRIRVVQMKQYMDGYVFPRSVQESFY